MTASGSLADRTTDLRRRDLGGWSSEQLVHVLVANAVGLLAILASAFEANRATELGDAVAWLNLGVLGLAVAAVSNAMWLLRGRESVSFARVLLLPSVDAVTARLAPVVARTSLPLRGASPTEDTFAAGQGLTRYHRPSCALISGRVESVARRDVHEHNGLRPCEVCRP